MQLMKKSVFSILLCATILSLAPNIFAMSSGAEEIVKSTAQNANSFSVKKLAVMLLAAPIILIYIQDLLPKEIRESAIFKKVIGTLEKDPEFKISCIDQDVYKGKLTEKQAATGLVGCFHAKFIKPIKKITDDCKLMRDTLALVALIVGSKSLVEALMFKDDK